jgi:hypothetical protein
VRAEWAARAEDVRAADRTGHAGPPATATITGVNADRTGRHPYAVEVAFWAQVGVALLLPVPVMETSRAVSTAARRATQALGDQPDLRYHLDGYRSSSTQMLAILGLTSLVFAGLLLRLALRYASTGRGFAAALIWPWAAFLFVFCAARVNPGTGWRLVGDDGDYIVNDYLATDRYLRTLTVLACASAALCLLNTAAMLANGRTTNQRQPQN